jgi:hypothetical protein
MGTPIHEISDGTTTVSFITPSPIVALPDGFGETSLTDDNLNMLDPISGNKVVESYKLSIHGSSQDAAASEARKLAALLRNAARYEVASAQITPVWMKQQGSEETNPRYALIYGAKEMSLPHPADRTFRFLSWLQTMGLTIIREHPWRSAIPGTLPTALTLTKTNGPVDAMEVDVVNNRTNVGLSYVYNYDSSLTTFSANMVAATSITLWSVSGATPAVNDAIYIGTNAFNPPKNFILDIATPGVYSATVKIQAYISGAWTDLIAGSGYSIYPSGTPSTLFQSIARYVINFEGGANWQTVAINGQTIFWIRILLSAVASWTTTPMSHGTYVPYLQKVNYIELPNTAIGGDFPPKMCLRLLNPAGAAADPCLGAPSRVILGAKSRGLTNFNAYLGLSGSFPSGWANAYGTDAAATADPSSPEGYMAAVSFATDSTMVARITLTGTAHLTEWVGRYSVFLIAQQIGGANGDTQVRIRTFIGGSSAGYPSLDSETVKLASHDAGYEIVDLGRLALPFGELTAADSLGTDVIFQLLAERITGASTLRLASIVLIPIDEWACVIEDPLSNIVSGSSALRGSTAVDLDGGILRGRTLKYVIAGSTFYPAETWNRDGRPPAVEPAKQTRIYFLMMHYPVDWGTGPMMAPAAMHLVVRVYTHDLYNTLRGND